jgi:hypothetical protein
MLDTAGKASVMTGASQLDGFAIGSDKKNATRLMVGTWTAF